MTEMHGLRFLERDRSYLSMSAVVAFSIIRGAETDHNELTKADIRAFLTANRY